MAEKQTISIDVSQLPEGMDPAKVIEILKSAQAKQVSSEKQRKVRSYAITKLTEKYDAEYQAFRAEAEAKFDAGTL